MVPFLPRLLRFVTIDNWARKFPHVRRSMATFGVENFPFQVLLDGPPFDTWITLWRQSLILLQVYLSGFRLIWCKLVHFGLMGPPGIGGFLLLASLGLSTTQYIAVDLNHKLLHILISSHLHEWGRSLALVAFLGNADVGESTFALLVANLHILLQPGQHPTIATLCVRLTTLSRSILLASRE